jgi:hypothetical protein
MGPPDSPQADIDHLLAPSSRVDDSMAQIMPAAVAAGLAYRVTEANSCYRGGKPGVSNALASALWGGDYMLALAAKGCQGVHFHGGPGAQIAASNGDKMPGARTAEDEAVAKLGTFYSPFAGSLTVGFSARPLFYGLMLAQQLAGRSLMPSQLQTGGVNATAYVARSGEGYRIAVFNKDLSRDLRLTFDLGDMAGRAAVWRLTGPSLDATTGVTLGGAALSPGDADWSPRRAETVDLASANGLFIPSGSAALILG